MQYAVPCFFLRGGDRRRALVAGRYASASVLVPAAAFVTATLAPNAMLRQTLPFVRVATGAAIAAALRGAIVDAGMIPCIALRTTFLASNGKGRGFFCASDKFRELFFDFRERTTVLDILHNLSVG